MTLIRLPMPEGGDERTAVFYRHHNCTNAPAFRRAMQDRDIDQCEYNVGSHGEGMPSGTPFPVRATYHCNVCGEYPVLWFEWSAPKLFLL